MSELFTDLGRAVSHRCSVGELPLLVVSGVHRPWENESGRTRRKSGSRQRKSEEKRRRGRSEGWIGDYCQVMAVEQERERARSVTEMCVVDDGQCCNYQKVILVVR